MPKCSYRAVTSCHCAWLSCNYAVRLQFQGMCLLCQAFPAMEAPENPTRPSMRPAHPDQHFQEFCFPQIWSDLGDVAGISLAGSRWRGCSQALVAGMSLKPPKGVPAWPSSIRTALAPQSDLVAFQPFCFLRSVVVLTSVFYCRPQ